MRATSARSGDSRGAAAPRWPNIKIIRRKSPRRRWLDLQRQISARFAGLAPLALTGRRRQARGANLGRSALEGTACMLTPVQLVLLTWRARTRRRADPAFSARRARATLRTPVTNSCARCQTRVNPASRTQRRCGAYPRSIHGGMCQCRSLTFYIFLFSPTGLRS